MARIQAPSNTGLTAPVWAGDFLSRDHLIPGGAKVDAAQFNVNSAVVVTLTAQANANATSLAVAALSGAIPAGTLLYFGEAGELARVNAAAAAAATSLAVDAIPAQIESGDVATYQGLSMMKSIPSGTPLGRTISERDAGTGYGPATDTDDEIYLLAYDITDAVIGPDCDLYRHNSIVKENFVPGWAGFSSNLKAALRSRYRCTVGQP